MWLCAGVAVVVAGALVVVLLGAFSRTVLDNAAVVQGIRTILTTSYGIADSDIQEVSYPTDQPIETRSPVHLHGGYRRPAQGHHHQGAEHVRRVRGSSPMSLGRGQLVRTRSPVNVHNGQCVEVWRWITSGDLKPAGMTGRSWAMISWMSTRRG